MKLRKVHLRSVQYQNRVIAAHCGRGYVTTDDLEPDITVLAAEQMVWVPREYQCVRCHNELVHYLPHNNPEDVVAGCDAWSATPTMRIAVESFVLELDRLHYAAAETHPHDERGCYHRQADDEACWCGVRSLTDMKAMASWLRRYGAQQLVTELGVSPAALFTDLVRFEEAIDVIHAAQVSSDIRKRGGGL